MKVVKVICALFIFGFVSMSHAAVIFITEKDANGVVTSLLGADNVEVNGLFYNVRFLDGTCIALFNGCDDATDFVFNTSDTATSASRALLAQVFIDGGDGMFDSSSNLINGCSSFFCGTSTVYNGSNSTDYIMSAFIRNYSVGRRYAASTVELRSEIASSVDYVHSSQRNFAVWSVAVSAPGTAMILLVGIAGLLVSQRRKQA
jgi:hypothetical protein